MSLVNQNWIGLHGEPVTGRIPPRLLVMNGVGPNPQQMGMIAHHYKLLTYMTKVSVTPFLIHERTLTDGTRIRMVSNYGVDTVMVWPAGGGKNQEDFRGFIAWPHAVTRKQAVNYALLVTTELYTTKSVEPILMRYKEDVGVWKARKKNYKPGSPTNYFVAHTPARIDHTKVRKDRDFFDVAYVKENRLYVSWNDKLAGPQKTLLLKDLPATGSVPIFFPSTGKKPRSGKDSIEYFHVFQTSPSGVKHIAGLTNKLEGDFSIQDTVSPRLPIVASPVGSTCFGYDPQSNYLTFFGTHATYTGPNSQYLNIYHWYARLFLMRSPPYVRLQDITPSPAPIRNYQSYIDPFDNADRTNETLPAPKDYVMPSSGIVYDIFVYTTQFHSDPEPTASFKYFVAVDSYGGETAGSTPHIYGNTKKITFQNTITPYDASYPVGTSMGIRQLTHKTDIAIDYTNESSTASIYYSAPLPTGYYSVFWAGLLFNPTSPPEVHYGGSSISRITDNGSTNVTYAIDGITLLNMRARHNFSYVAGSSSQVTYHPDGRAARMTGMKTGDPYPVPRDEDPGRRYAYSILAGLSPYYSKSYETKPKTPEIMNTSRLDMEVRDYIFHDMYNGVAVYLRAVAQGENTSNLEINAYQSGGGMWQVDVVVEARGKTIVVPIATISTDGHNLSIINFEAIYGGASLNPRYIEPVYIPAIYAPVCEQGDFPYIAYTTKDELEKNVSDRFILSLPLGIVNREVSINATIPPPSHCYVLTAYNLSEAGRHMRGALFSELLGRAFHINVTNDGSRDWIVDLQTDEPGDAPTGHYAECYRV